MRFHHYLYGREFICLSDHKLLEDIHLKHLSDASPRLQRLLLKIQPYILSLSMFQVKTSQWQMYSVGSAQMRKQKTKVLMSSSMNSLNNYPEYKLSPSRRQHNRTRHFSYLFNRCWKVGLNLTENYQRSLDHSGNGGMIYPLNTPASPRKVGSSCLLH